MKPTTPQRDIEREDSDAMANALMERLGPHALTGGKMSLIEAFEQGWQARAAQATAEPVALSDDWPKGTPHICGLNADYYGVCPACEDKRAAPDRAPSADPIAFITTDGKTLLFGDSAHTVKDQATLVPLCRCASADRAAGWQPIETAPKDGTQVMLTNGAIVAQGWWEHEEPYIREERDIEGYYMGQAEHDGFDGWLDCEGGMTPDPTHWMPLPPPPAIAASAPQQGEGRPPYERRRFER